jgi:hypothetical protein
MRPPLFQHSTTWNGGARPESETKRFLDLCSEHHTASLLIARSDAELLVEKVVLAAVVTATSHIANWLEGTVLFASNCLLRSAFAL